MKVRNGYTLLEVCVVLFIVGILGSISVPAISKTLAPSITERESKKIAHWVELIAIKAAYRRDDIVVTHNMQTLLAHGTLNPKKPLSKRVLPSLISFSIGRPSLRFYRTGVCTPATLRINGADGSCLIRLSLRGRVLVECEKR